MSALRPRIRHSSQFFEHPTTDIQPFLTRQASAAVSLRREDYYRVVQAKPISANRAAPSDPSFDAERAIAYYMQQGDIDEAGWLDFLMTHFSRHLGTGWRRLQDVYGALGAGKWDWATVSAIRSSDRARSNAHMLKAVQCNLLE